MSSLRHDVPPKYGNWNTTYRRFRHWSEAGVWEAVTVTLAEIMANSRTISDQADDPVAFWPDERDAVFEA
ncbi:transposase [Sphingomonas oryzagri]